MDPACAMIAARSPDVWAAWLNVVTVGLRVPLPRAWARALAPCLFTEESLCL